MIRSIATFEFRYQLRQPLFWVTATIFFLLTFGATTIDQISIGNLGPGDHRNSPYAILQTHLVLSLFYMFVTAAFVANVILRDDETGFGPIIRSTRIQTFDYLFGRFSGAFAAVALSFTAVPIAIMVGAIMPWIDPERIGPFQLGWYAFAFGVLALPSLFLTSAIFFLTATVTRSLTWTYIAVILVLSLWIMGSVAFDKPQYDEIAALVEPFGVGAFGLATKYWTTADRNSLLPQLSGALAINRLAVIGVALLALVATWAIFDFRSAQPGSKSRRKPQSPDVEEVNVTGLRYSELARPDGTWSANWARLVARTRLDMAQVFGSPAYLVLLAIGFANATAGLWFTTDEGRYGGVIYPVTRVLIPVLEGSFSIITIIVAIFYAGELVWRERDKRTHELIDAMPVPDWAFVVPKLVAIILVLISTLIISVIAAILVQILNGYSRFEFDKYFMWYVLPQSFDWILMAILAMFIQTVSTNKFFGWGLMILYFVCTLTLRNIGLEDNLILYGSGSPVPLSDMNGQGQFWIGAWWFRLYWSALALGLGLLTYALWRRGTEMRIVPRLLRLPRRFRGSAGKLAIVGLVVFCSSGVVIVYNTHVINPYRTKQDDERWQADFEHALRGYESLPQPTITAVNLVIDLHPTDHWMTTNGTYRIVNRTRQPLRQIHILFDRDTKVQALTIEGARPKTTFDQFNYRIFQFDLPMQPGEMRSLSFSSRIGQRGFRNSNNETGVVDNGTFVNNSRFAPGLGVDRRAYLQDRTKRRKYGLSPEQHMPPLGDAQSLNVNNFRHDGDWVAADITVTTDGDQTPLAPGDIVSDQTIHGRRTVRFIANAPILNFISVQSARYAIRRDNHHGIALAVYHDPQHAWNRDRMIAVQKQTLDYATANFGPYPFHQLRFVEFPDYAQFAQAFAGTVPWSEGLFFIANYKDQSKIDMVTYVGAHEIGHQWWAHQLLPADQQGATALTETLSQYTALMVMKHLYGQEKLRKFLKFELDSYLRARGGSVLAEQPIARVEEDQGYVHYRKGSLVMYRLTEEIGEDSVNRALRALLERFGRNGPPYPNANDLINALRAETPADKQVLITDLFERICLYDLKTTEMTVKRRADNQFDVSLTVEAEKLYANGRGAETKAPMEEVVDVGLFLTQPSDKAFTKANVIAFERRPIHSGGQILHFTVRQPPKFGGLDPYNVFIDRNSDDNIHKAN